MADTAHDTIATINALRSKIAEAVARIGREPFPTKERFQRLDELEHDAEEIIKRTEAEMAEVPLRRELAKLHQEMQRYRDVEGREESRFTRAISKASGDELKALRDEQASGREHLKSVLDELHKQSIQVANQIEEASAYAKTAPPSPALRACLDDMGALLTRAGNFERATKNAEAESLSQSVAAQFKADTEQFSIAIDHHENQAFLMLAGMLILLLVAAYLVKVMLFDLPSLTGKLPDTGAIEETILLVTGRLAFLAGIGWALRFFATLHRGHAEQAIIYRDKKSALGVAEVIVNAAPLEQKRDVLQQLADSYLRFDDSAFLKSRHREEAKEGIDAQIRRLKRVVQAMKPVLDVASQAVTKKDK